MNKIVYSYKTETEIPETLKESYVYNEETATYILDGFAPKEEVESHKRRADHIKGDKERAEQAIKDIIGDRKPSEVKEILKRLEEEKTTKKPSETKSSDVVPIEEYIKIKEQLEKVLPDFENLKSYKEETEKERKTRLIVEQLQSEGLKAKMNADVIEDLGRYASDFTLDDNGNVFIDLGNYNRLTPEKWVDQMKEKKPSWFPQVVGGGMRGGGSGGGVLENPYLGDNKTHIMNFRTKHGDAKATEYAKLAGKNKFGIKL